MQVYDVIFLALALVLIGVVANMGGLVGRKPRVRRTGTGDVRGRRRAGDMSSYR